MSLVDLKTPAELGYRFPAEWEKHAGTWLSYPHNEASWPGKIHTIFPFYHEFIRNLAKGEMVNINVISREMHDHVEEALNSVWCKYGTISPCICCRQMMPGAVIMVLPL